MHCCSRNTLRLQDLAGHVPRGSGAHHGARRASNERRHRWCLQPTMNTPRLHVLVMSSLLHLVPSSLPPAPRVQRPLDSLLFAYEYGLNGSVVFLAGETTTDHLDLMDGHLTDSEQDHGYSHERYQQQHQHQHQVQGHPRSSRLDQGGVNGGRANAYAWADGDDASAQWSRAGRGEGKGFEESWKGDGEGGEGRPWKHEDLKQLLQVLAGSPCVRNQLQNP